MPSLRPWLNVPPERLLESERQVVATINELSGDLGMKPLDVLADLFEVDAEFLCTFAELDHYPRSGATYWGPRFASEEGVVPEWPAGSGERIFAYLSTAHFDFERLVGQLRDLPYRTLIHASGVSEKQVAKYQARNLVFSVEPVRMTLASRDSDLVVCHGGHGTTAASLLAGRPVLAVHRHVEQLLLAQNLVSRGLAQLPQLRKLVRLGKTVNPDSKAPSYKQMVREIFSDSGFADRARAFAAKYADFDISKQTLLLATRCEAILAGAIERNA